MESEEYQELYNDVIETKGMNMEALARMTRYALESFLRCLIVFGHKSAITKDCLNVIREYKAIITEENRLLTLLLTSPADIDRKDMYFNLINDLSDKTISYYYQVLDDIDDAVECRDEMRGKRYPKHFETLIETDYYRNVLYSLSISFADVKEYLGYEEEFWEYIDTRTTWIEPFGENPRYFYGVNFKEEEGIVTDLHVTIPSIVDLDTAKIVVHEIRHAHDLYESIMHHNKLVSDQELEGYAREEETTFVKQYVLPKYTPKR